MKATPWDPTHCPYRDGDDCPAKECGRCAADGRPDPDDPWMLYPREWDGDADAGPDLDHS